MQSPARSSKTWTRMLVLMSINWSPDCDSLVPKQQLCGIVCQVKLGPQNIYAEAHTSLEGQLPPGLKLEDVSALQLPGTKDGQIKVIREAGAGMAYSWDSAQ